MTRATKSKFGIIHFDAHHDVRNFEDGGRTNGTPFRTILESGAVSGKNVVQIGLRDFVNAKAYHEYVLGHGVTVFTARQVFKQGLSAILEQAMTIAGQNTDAIYVSFDMDVLDQSFVPGVPAPSPGGITIWDAIEALEWLGDAEERAGTRHCVCRPNARRPRFDDACGIESDVVVFDRTRSAKKMRRFKALVSKVHDSIGCSHPWQERRTSNN